MDSQLRMENTVFHLQLVKSTDVKLNDTYKRVSVYLLKKICIIEPAQFKAMLFKGLLHFCFICDKAS